MARFRNARTTTLGVAVTALSLFAGARSASAATTYEVGPGKAYPNVNAVAPLLQPGDVVLVQGGATYPAVTLERSGTAAAKITIRGVPVNGKRPSFQGGSDTIHAAGSHYVFESIDVTGGANRCFFHHANDITLRDAVVHDCPSHGVLGADDDSGSLRMEYVEVTRSGRGDRLHPIYIATDERAFPGSTFRMEHCFVHDNVGGNNVKSRAERNEIYFNWIEGATYHEIELIGPEGEDPALKREDSDVVGNVFVQTGGTFMVRVGGDGGGGSSNGRVRFLNNTFVANNGNPIFRLWDALESLELHNNVFYAGGRGVSLVDQSRVEWATGRAAIAGTNNWVPEGSALVPSELAATLTGRDPRFVAAERRDVRVAEGSPLANAGNPSPQPVAGRAVPAALLAPLFDPPLRTLERVGSARRRADLARPSIGAFHLPAPTRAPNGESPPKGGDTGAEDPSSSTPSPGDPLGPSGSDAPPQGGATGPFLPALGAPYFDTLEQGGCSLARTKGGPRSAGAEAMLFAVGLVALGAKARRKKP